MADTKDGRNKQADDADKRQRERELTEALERSDEPEPPLDEEPDEASGENETAKSSGEDDEMER